MSQPFIGEIKLFGGNFAIRGWAFCSGQLLAVSQNDALFALIGTTYGGDGQTTFALPDLRGRVPIHQGNGHTIGELGGVETVTLTGAQNAQHTHQAIASTSGGSSSTDPTNNFWSRDPGGQVAQYRGTSTVTMNAGVLANAGGSQPHNNIMPFLVINFIIALEGIFPSQN